MTAFEHSVGFLLPELFESRPAMEYHQKSTK